jgi:hypothetical protein
MYKEVIKMVKVEVVGKNSEDMIETLSTIEEVREWLREKDFKMLQEFGVGDTICREYKQKVVFNQELQRWVLFNSIKDLVDFKIENDKVYAIVKSTNTKKEKKVSDFGWITVREID